MSEKCKNKIHCFLRPATVADIRELRRLFQDTVLTVNAKDYTPEEVKDWASCGDSTAHWEDLLSRFHFLVALNAGKQIVGFASVNGEGYLHSMFIHKDWQRKGIASALLSEMESYAGGRGAGEIISEVSITARPFFERQGYTVRKEQKARANRLELTNFVMTKKLQK